MGITSDQDTTGHTQFVADIHDAATEAAALLQSDIGGYTAGEAFYRLTSVFSG